MSLIKITIINVRLLVYQINFFILLFVTSTTNTRDCNLHNLHIKSQFINVILISVMNAVSNGRRRGERVTLILDAN